MSGMFVSSPAPRPSSTAATIWTPTPPRRPISRTCPSAARVGPNAPAEPVVGQSGSGRTIRVLHVVTRMNVGGPARHLQTLLPRLASLGVEPVLMHGVVDEDEGEIALEDERVAVLRNPWLRRAIDPVADLRASNELRRAIAWIRPDVIHTHMAKAGALGRQAADAAGVPSIHTF